MDSKICSNCKKELTIDNFHKQRTGKFGVQTQCKECRNKKDKERNKPINTDANIKRSCTDCGKEFPATLEYFHRSKSGKFGVTAECKECFNKRQKEKNNPINTDASIKQVCTGECGEELPATLEYFNRNKKGKFGVAAECKECVNKRDKERNIPPNTDVSIKQTCINCREEFPATTEFFHKKRSGKFGVASECKECCKKRNNPPNTDINIKQTCTDCGEELPATLEYFHKKRGGKFGVRTECKECRSQWQKDNRDKINEYIKNKYQNDEQYRIRQLLSAGLWQALNNIGQSKNASILDYIGCDIAFLQQYLNNTKGDNWGDVVIDIDHIIPKSLYDHTNEEEIKKCWNWRNLRYFPKSDNISKGNILDMSLVKQYGVDDLLPDF